MKALTEYRTEIREAFWLWWLLSVYTVPSAERWWRVNDGSGDGAYSDENIASALDVPVATARRWRMKLETAGLIRTFLVARRKRRFEMLNLDFSNGRLDVSVERASALPTAAVN